MTNPDEPFARERRRRLWAVAVPVALVVVAIAFLVWRSNRTYEVSVSVTGTTCNVNVYSFHGTAENLQTHRELVTPPWHSPTLTLPRVATFTVVATAMGDCEQLSCRTVIDGRETPVRHAPAGENRQVTCDFQAP